MDNFEKFLKLLHEATDLYFSDRQFIISSLASRSGDWETMPRKLMDLIWHIDSFVFTAERNVWNPEGFPQETSSKDSK